MHVDEHVGDEAFVRILQEVAVGARSEGREEVTVVAGDGEHDDLGRREAGSDLPARGDAASRHVYVEEAQIRLAGAGRVDRCGGIGGLGADVEPAVLGEQGGQVGSGRCVIVSDEDANGLTHATSTSIVVPSPSRDSHRNSAPTDAARSRIAMSPKPALTKRSLSGSNPTPSSVTSRRTPLPFVSRTSTRSACAWRTALMTASDAMRTSASWATSGT